MPATFAYTAIDRAGHRYRAIEVAPSESALVRGVQTRGLILVEVSETSGATPAATSSTRGSGKREVLEFTRTVAALLVAGLPLTTALETAESLSGGLLRDAVATARSRIVQGGRLADALAEHPGFFSSLYVGLVRAGDRSGDLSGAFDRLSVQLEREESLRNKLISASLYPLLLATAGGLAVLVLLFLVVPRFAELLQGTGGVLPASTSALLGFSATLRHGWPFLAAAVLAAALAVGWMQTTEEGRRAGSNLLLGLPGIGSLRRQALAARFARLLATLVGGGAPLLGALDDTLECLTDPLARDEVTQIRSRVRDGATLHAAIGAGVSSLPCWDGSWPSGTNPVGCTSSCSRPPTSWKNARPGRSSGSSRLRSPR